MITYHARRAVTVCRSCCSDGPVGHLLSVQNSTEMDRPTGGWLQRLVQSRQGSRQPYLGDNVSEPLLSFAMRRFSSASGKSGCKRNASSNWPIALETSPWRMKIVPR